MKVNFTWKLPNLPRSIDKAVEVGLVASGQTLANGIRGSFGSSPNRSPSAPGSPPNRQTSNLAGSIRRSPVVARRTSVFTTVIYARVQEEGKTIVAKGGYLAVPISDKAKTRSRNAKGARGISPETLILRSKRGNLIIFEKRGKRNPKLIPHYVLKKSVTLPARPFMRPGFMKYKDAATREFVRLASETLAREITS